MQYTRQYSIALKQTLMVMYYAHIHSDDFSLGGKHTMLCSQWRILTRILLLISFTWSEIMGNYCRQKF